MLHFGGQIKSQTKEGQEQETITVLEWKCMKLSRALYSVTDDNVEQYSSPGVYS